MLRRPCIKRSAYLFLSLFLLVILSSCTQSAPPSSSSGMVTPDYNSSVAPVGLQVPVCHLKQCINFNPVKGTRPFIDTSNNIHSALVFDFRVTDPAAIANNYDFVWGARMDHMAAYRSANPNLILSYYMTIHRDNGAFADQTNPGTLTYWQQVHPDWVLYKCDQKTPALEYGDKNIPFDITNPEVVNWQLQNYVQPASEADYDALAVDNIDMENLFGACGHFDKQGKWVQLYTGSTNDVHWQTDMANWVVQMQAKLHALPHPLLLIGNVSIGVVTVHASTARTVLGHVDGVLDESSFTHFGKNPPLGDDWLHKVQYIDSVQEMGKPFFIVNQVQKELEPADTEWIYASYLMCNQRLASINISSYKAYGYARDFPEQNANIGSATSDMYKSQNVYWRDFTGGEVVVNPNGASVQVTTSGSTTYVDPYGKKPGHSFTLPPYSARILLKS